MAGVCNDHGKTYALYTITVQRRNPDGSDDFWKTYRRYSDFHDFHMRITEQVKVLPNYCLCFFRFNLFLGNGWFHNPICIAAMRSPIMPYESLKETNFLPLDKQYWIITEKFMDFKRYNFVILFICFWAFYHFFSSICIALCTIHTQHLFACNVVIFRPQFFMWH